MRNGERWRPETGVDIAIIGLAGRFPGARDVDAFWANLRAGVESIRFFSNDELRSSGVDPQLLADPHYVKAAPVLEGFDLFDASFFGYAPQEARTLDPQHRLFLECAWEALEDAGYDVTRYTGAIGVYGGCASNTYLLSRGACPVFGDDYVLMLTGNDKDFLSTRISYKLNLTGPSVSVQTACSTSLVAVHLACQGLLNGECDMALAGAVSVRVPQIAGHLYRKGGVFTPDGHCRAFDARASGTIFGSGVGMVVLKLLPDALAAGDSIHAIIKGSAVNNDGATKADYAAPSLEMQARAVEEALAHAGVPADTISYVEAHGTGTSLGDPIEIAALTKAFREATADRSFCAIGSVKTNIGHLDAAAGIAGLIKTVLSLRHRELPPSLHFERPNPHIDFAESPFYVNSRLAPWNPRSGPRRAGVSSLGIGGTNAHVVLEEAPAMPPSGPSRPRQLLLLSAKRRSSLDQATAGLARHLRLNQNRPLADAAFTLQVGRAPFRHRRMLVCEDTADAVAKLERLDPRQVPSGDCSPGRPIVFMFPGGGTQYPLMGVDLYDGDATFRGYVDDALERFARRGVNDLRPLIAGNPPATVLARLDRPSVQLPMIFVLEYALARLWLSWGVRPSAAIGHSMGEVTAAWLSGVVSIEDAVGLVAARGRLIEATTGGGMLSVALSADELEPLLGGDLDLAAVNLPNASVASGPDRAIESLAVALLERGVDVQRLRVPTAAHSRMLDPIAEELGLHLRRVDLKPPTVPFMSNLTGTWITPAQATDPDYWVRQLRQTVRFSDGVTELLKRSGTIFLEIGPGQTLSSFVRLHPGRAADHVVVSSLGPSDRRLPEVASLLTAAGTLWISGVDIDWPAFSASERRRRVSLPPYSFDRQRYWIDSPDESGRVGRRRRTSSSTRARPAAAKGDARRRSPRQASLTTVETAIASVWEDVLGIQHVGVHEDFFELGGGSLQATQTIARLNQLYQTDLSVINLLATPTVAGLAQSVSGACRKADPPER